MKQIDISSFSGVEFGENVIIRGTNVTIKKGAKIGNDVCIYAENISIGYDSIIEKETVIKGLGEDMQHFEIGDNCFIGFRTQILLPEFSMKDFSQLHNSGLHSGYKPLTIGYNCWIGQSSILNATERLEIGNNVRIGTQSQLWTHVASGELLEGCTLYGSKSLILKDNVWIVGGAVISPGLVLERNSIIMTGSVLTKSTEPFNTYAGVPAKNVTDKLNFWTHNDLEKKFDMMQNFVQEFLTVFPHYNDSLILVESITENDYKNYLNKLVVCKICDDFSTLRHQPISLFDIASKKYLKQRWPIEIDWIKFNLGFRARFTPLEHY